MCIINNTFIVNRKFIQTRGDFLLQKCGYDPADNKHSVLHPDGKTVQHGESRDKEGYHGLVRSKEQTISLQQV